MDVVALTHCTTGISLTFCIESGATKVKHECKAKSEEGAEGAETKVEDEIEFEVSAKGDKGICIAVKYEQEIEDDVTETETDAEFEVCFQELLEYTKGENSTDQAYDWGVSDSELQSIPLTNWDDFGEVMTDDTGMSTFTATSPDGFVNMTFTISPAGDGERITANSMKADVRIVNFPWTEGADSYLTLLSDVESKLEVEVDEEIDDELDEVEEAVDMPEEDEPVDEPEPTEADEPEPTEGDPMDEPEPTDEMPDDGGASRFLNKKAPKLKDAKISFGDVVDTIGVNVFGSVTWADTAVAATNDSDAVEVGRAEKIIQVIATKPPEGSERYLQDKTREQIAFSFVGEPAQGSPDIFWDPEAGVGYSADSSTTSGVGALMSSASVIGGLVGTLFLLANV